MVVWSLGEESRSINFFGILVSPAPWEGLRLFLAWNIPSKQRGHFLPDIAPGNTTGRRHIYIYIYTYKYIFYSLKIFVCKLAF